DEVLLDLDEELGVGETHLIAGRGTAHIGVGGTGHLHGGPRNQVPSALRIESRSVSSLLDRRTCLRTRTEPSSASTKSSWSPAWRFQLRRSSTGSVIWPLLVSVTVRLYGNA